MIKLPSFHFRMYGDLCVVAIKNSSVYHYHYSVSHNAYIAIKINTYINFHRRLLKYEEVRTICN